MMKRIIIPVAGRFSVNYKCPSGNNLNILSRLRFYVSGPVRGTSQMWTKKNSASDNRDHCCSRLIHDC
jgi:hypothetical protein